MPDPNPAKTLVKLATKFVGYQGKRLIGEGFAGEVMNALTEYVGEDATDKLTTFFDQGAHAAQLVAAFTEADAAFAQTIDSPDLALAIHDLKLARLPSLEKLADALPKTLDDAPLLAALRARFAEDYPHLAPAQLDHAARVYRDCLERALATKCNQLLPTLFRHVVEIRDGVREMLPLVKGIHKQVTSTREWQRPSPPRADPGFVGRAKELDDVCKMLTPGTRTAITATVHGTPGVGKTWLARQLAEQLDTKFPDGVIVQDIGSAFRSADLCTPILDEWGKRTGCPPESNQHLTPAEVRDWLASHNQMLFVLDDIWDAAAIVPLLHAVPNGACVLMTTRNRKLANESSDKTYSLDILSPEDALVLVRDRMKKATDADKPLLIVLVNALGRHAQALDLAARQLDRRAKSQWKQNIGTITQQVQAGTGFGELAFPNEEVRESNVETALKISYDDLTPQAQTHFRALGAFALDASFRTTAAAGVWDCSEEKALGQLTNFYERGLLTARDDERWQQHSLLRAYALALLTRANETATARERHTAVYLTLMRDTDDKQIYYLMLPDYAQVHFAFEWTVEHDFEMAQSIAANTANFQAQFNLARDSVAWSFRLVELTRQAKNEGAIVQSLLLHSNALRLLANMFGEDSVKRLGEALDANYNALRHCDPNIAPLSYATLQSNRSVILVELATLPNENRITRLHEALTACDEALSFKAPKAASWEYANILNIRSGILGQLAMLQGEDRPARLREALADIDTALEICRPHDKPLDYVNIQNNRANILIEISKHPNEDRFARLQDALNSYKKTLRYLAPDETPLNYGIAQLNLGILNLDLAEQGENRRACIRLIIQHDTTAFTLFQQIHHATYTRRAASLLQYAQAVHRDLFSELWGDLDLGEIPGWLK